MKEDIMKKAQISDDDLEQISGGYWTEDGNWIDECAPNCPNCNIKMMTASYQGVPFYLCDSCGHMIEIEP